MVSAAIEPRAPVPPPGSASVDPTSRGRPDRRGPRDGRRPASPRQPVRDEDEPEAPPPAPGRLDILA